MTAPRWVRKPSPEEADDSVVDACMELVRDGLMDCLHDPETGEKRFRLTDAGVTSASRLIEDLTATEQLTEEGDHA